MFLLFSADKTILSIVYILPYLMTKEKLFIDYPKDTKRGYIANTFMRGMTILAVIFMIIGSVKSVESSFSNTILVVELILSCVFLVDLLIRAHLSGWKMKFFLNIFNIFDLIASLPFIIAF